MFKNNLKQSPFRALLLFFIFTVFITTIGGAQTNLVPNYSFENYILCPIYTNPPPLPWYNPGKVVGSYSDSCSNNNYTGVPYNHVKGSISFQYAKTGGGYAFLDYQNGGTRTYLQIKLINSLKVGHHYYAEHFVNVPNPMGYSCNNVGMLFTDSAVYVDTVATPFGVLKANPQVVNYGNPVIWDTLNWIKVSGVFKAKGGEQYLTLGNFKDDAHTMFVKEQTKGYGGAGFYIDDVAVYDLDSFRLQADAGRDTVITKGDSAWIGSYTNGIDTIQWLQNGVTVIDSTRPGFWVYPSSNTYYVLTQTVNGYTSRDTVFVNVQPLPVSMLNFECLMLNERHVKVSWQTATEINVSHFNVQLSSDGISFNTIGKVDAKGAGSYTFNDPLTIQVSRFTTLYYRLEIVDKNGSTTYSEIKELSIINSTLSITPNPAKDYITINSGNIKEMIISDASGRVLIMGKEKRVDVSSLAAGIYYVTIQTINGARTVQKLVKM